MHLLVFQKPSAGENGKDTATSANKSGAKSNEKSSEKSNESKQGSEEKKAKA